MSQKATRKSHTATAATEEKEKVDTPVKEMKKKIAANAEKEKEKDKLAAEKSEKPAEKPEKNDATDKGKAAEKPDKNGDKSDAHKDKQADKKADMSKDKQADKKVDTSKDKQADKKTDKQEKVAEKKQDKTDKKQEKPAEKKADGPTEKDDKVEKPKEKSSGVNGTHNGAANGTDHGTVSDDSDVELVMEEDELFPELTYDDSGSDEDEPLSRSHTRRSQVKPTKTPETPAPRPASDANDDSKLLKLKEDTITSDRKLRSADSPKPEAKKLEKKPQESPKKQEAGQDEEKKSAKKDAEGSKKEHDKEADKKEQKEASNNEKKDKIEVEVIAEAESSDSSQMRTRARVSPYTRTRLDRTATSVMADYTGNNSTMEMDITESSLAEEAPLDDSAYLRGLRAIRGRSSYKKLGEITFSQARTVIHAQAPPAFPSRPLGTVVGRKRKPSPSPPAVERGEEASEDLFATHGKRMRLLDRLAMPFRRSVSRRAADIVGINTDLPLTAPVASTSFASFDPETIKAAPVVTPGEPLATPLPPVTVQDRDGKSVYCNGAGTTASR